MHLFFVVMQLQYLFPAVTCAKQITTAHGGTRLYTVYRMSVILPLNFLVSLFISVTVAVYT